MSYGFADQKAARRRQWRIVRWMFATAIFLVLGVTSYWTGAKLAVLEVSRLEQEVDALSKSVAELGEKNDALRERAAAAGRNEQKWQAKYKTEVPTGKSRELHALIVDQMKKGADPRRIAFLVNTAARRQSCDGDAQTKRFLLRTPLYAGANDSVSFARNTIIVTGQGATASSAEGDREAWFDPAKPVSLRFAAPGGAATEATGPLPLHHSVVRGDSEYRFSIVASDNQGFVSVTAERCKFP